MKAFFITLNQVPARALNASFNMRDFEKSGYSVENVPAVDYRDQEFKKARVREGAGLAAGEIATSESHRRVHQRIVEQGETCLVVEDDAWFPFVLPQKWAQGVKHVMTCGAYDSSLENAPQLVFGEKLPFGIETEGMPWGTQAYFLTPEAARILLQASSPIQFPIDVLLDKLSREGALQGAVAANCCVGQNDLISSHVVGR